MLKRLATLANKCDRIGRYDLADRIDALLGKYAADAVDIARNPQSTTSQKLRQFSQIYNFLQLNQPKLHKAVGTYHSYTQQLGRISRELQAVQGPEQLSASEKQQVTGSLQQAMLWSEHLQQLFNLNLPNPQNIPSV